MPNAAVMNGATYTVHSDHLNTPRLLSNADGQPVWQWNYSAIGEDKPTIAKNRFANLDIHPTWAPRISPKRSSACAIRVSAASRPS